MWNIPEREFLLNPPRGFVFRQMHAEAQLLPDGRIAVSEKWFRHPPEIREFIVEHERGHIWEKRVLWGDDPDNTFKILDSETFGSMKDGAPTFIVSTFNLSEAMAESYAVYMTTPDELKRDYPRAFYFIEAMLQGASVDDAIELSSDYSISTLDAYWGSVP
tara:strand:+ start:3349 stop:3831 length:483 start_codon:yes stop_codon:yes gene_type:complete